MRFVCTQSGEVKVFDLPLEEDRLRDKTTGKIDLGTFSDFYPMDKINKNMICAAINPGQWNGNNFECVTEIFFKLRHFLDYTEEHFLTFVRKTQCHFICNKKSYEFIHNLVLIQMRNGNATKFIEKVCAILKSKNIVKEFAEHVINDKYFVNSNLKIFFLINRFSPEDRILLKMPLPEFKTNDKCLQTTCERPDIKNTLTNNPNKKTKLTLNNSEKAMCFVSGQSIHKKDFTDYLIVGTTEAARKALFDECLPENSTKTDTNWTFWAGYPTWVSKDNQRFILTDCTDVASALMKYPSYYRFGYEDSQVVWLPEAGIARLEGVQVYSDEEDIIDEVLKLGFDVMVMPRPIKFEPEIEPSCWKKLLESIRNYVYTSSHFIRFVEHSSDEE